MTDPQIAAARQWLNALDYDLSKETEDYELAELVVAIETAEDDDEGPRHLRRAGADVR
jgi:hypothetical protein